jgi:hypothetical protein
VISFGLRGSANGRTSFELGSRFPIEVRPDIGTLSDTRCANETRLDIGQPDIVRPPRTGVGTEPRPMAALAVRAIDQDAAHAGGAHLAEGDFLRSSLQGRSQVAGAAGATPFSAAQVVHAASCFA